MGHTARSSRSTSKLSTPRTARTAVAWRAGPPAALALLLSACAATVPPTALSGQTVASELVQHAPDLQLQSGFLSDQLALASEQHNGWGPAERDMANGAEAAGDGPLLSLWGATFKKGLDVHAASKLSFPVHGRCNRFQAHLGIDDSVRSGAGFGAYRLGSVVFQVFADATLLFESGVVTSETPTLTLDLKIPASAQTLRLVVSDGNDGSLLDDADWADAKVECTDR
jgi:NPCBM/NEW2 domain